MKVLGWVWFVIVQLIAFAFFLVGIVVLLPLAFARAWVDRPSRYFPNRTVTAWVGGWLTFPWGNEEDGVTGADFYQKRFKPSHLWLCAYLWSAWRNSANNLRFVFRWVGGPFFRWENTQRTFYMQAGFYPNGFPVLSAGRM